MPPSEAVVTESTSLPPDGFSAHQDLLRRLVAALYSHLQEVPERSHRLVGILAFARPFRVAFPVNEAILEPVKILWQPPSSLPPTAKRVERRYSVSSQGFELSYNHHPPRSLVVTAANERERLGHQACTPKGKKGSPIQQEAVFHRFTA